MNYQSGCLNIRKAEIWRIIKVEGQNDLQCREVLGFRKICFIAKTDH